jgi:hypothetical protein
MGAPGTVVTTTFLPTLLPLRIDKHFDHGIELRGSRLSLPDQFFDSLTGMCLYRVDIVPRYADEAVRAYPFGLVIHGYFSVSESSAVFSSASV